MALRIGINGFGRIGRNVLRAGWNNPNFEFVHINDLTNDDMLAFLLKNDSVHGRFDQDCAAVEGGLKIGDRLISTSASADPSKIPWGDKQVDVVLECTGRFVTKEAALPHLAAGAKKVIISAPAKGVDATVVVGVNCGKVDLGAAVIVSNASCTTNCLAPVAKVLHERFGIVQGLMTTVHSYTMDQNLLDSPHKKDFRRARAAALNMVPTSTGAAKAVGLVLPELEGKLSGFSVRVPTPNVSLVDLVVELAQDATAAQINAAISEAAAGPLKGILEASNAPLVSSDLIGNPHSSIVDLELTMVMGTRMAKVIAWYDNEWGFSCRMLDLAERLFPGGK